MLVAYTLEILPYRIRARGFAVMVSTVIYRNPAMDLLSGPLQNLTVILTTAFNQFVNPWAIKAIGWWYYLVYCGWLVVELLFIMKFIVETKGTWDEKGISTDSRPNEPLLQVGR